MTPLEALLSVDVHLLNPNLGRNMGEDARDAFTSKKKRNRGRRQRKAFAMFVSLEPRDAMPVPKYASGRGVRMLLAAPSTFSFQVSDEYRSRTMSYKACLETHDVRALIDMFRAGGF